MRNRLTELLGIELPILLGPFGGLSSVPLAAAVSDGGGLGSYGLYGYDAERIAETAARLRAATSAPFALNIWIPRDDEPSPADLAEGEWARAVDALRPFFDEVGLEPPAPPARFLPPLDEQVEAVVAARPAALSVVFGVPPAWLVERTRDAGIRLLGTATTVDEAIALEHGGVDAVIATGMEAGGHRVSFLEPAERSLVGTFALVPQVADAVAVPVIAAGGVADRRGVAAAFALGADGVQVGSAFLATRESAAPEGHRRAIRGAAAHATVLTRAMSGRLARGLPNRAVGAIEAGGEPARFPVQNWLTGRFRAEAGRRDATELLSLWMGQAAGAARGDTAAEVLEELRAGLPG